MDFKDGEVVVRDQQVMVCHDVAVGRCGEWGERFKEENPDGEERVWGDFQGRLLLCCILVVVNE